MKHPHNRLNIWIIIAGYVLVLRLVARGEDLPDPVGEPVTAEHFVPASAHADSGSTLEMRSEATVTGGEVKLKQICRWSDSQGHVFAPMAELVVARLPEGKPFASVSLDEVRHSLSDAGANLGTIKFAGVTSCTVSRTDVKYDEMAALDQWAAAREGKLPAGEPMELPAVRAAAAVPASLPATPAPSTAPAAPAPVSQPAGDGLKMLRDLLVADASVRLKVPAETLQLTFNPADEKLLNLSQPQFKFNLDAQRVWGLGEVTWEVQVITETGSRKYPVTADARAWVREVVLVRPVDFKQIIQAEDVTEKRRLTDHLPDETLLTMAQCVGQQTSRELKPGTVMTAAMVSPQELARPGQFITVTLSTGSIRIKTVARAMEGGTFGQTIKVKNEATNEQYEVALTGPQEGSVSPISLREAP